MKPTKIILSSHELYTILGNIACQRLGIFESSVTVQVGVNVKNDKISSLDDIEYVEVIISDAK